MIIYKNKVSGKYFIHIEDLEDNKALFVLPIDHKTGKVFIKSLELDLFDEKPEENEDEIFLERQLISKLQLEKYEQHREAVVNSLLHRMVAVVKNYSSYDKEKIRKEGGEKAEWLKFVEEELIKKGWDEE